MAMTTAAAPKPVRTIASPSAAGAPTTSESTSAATAAAMYDGRSDLTLLLRGREPIVTAQAPYADSMLRKSRIAKASAHQGAPGPPA